MQRIEAKSSTGTRKHKKKREDPGLGPGQKKIVDFFVKKANTSIRTRGPILAPCWVFLIMAASRKHQERLLVLSLRNVGGQLK